MEEESGEALDDLAGHALLHTLLVSLSFALEGGANPQAAYAELVRDVAGVDLVPWVEEEKVAVSGGT